MNEVTWWQKCFRLLLWQRNHQKEMSLSYVKWGRQGPTVPESYSRPGPLPPHLSPKRHIVPLSPNDFGGFFFKFWGLKNGILWPKDPLLRATVALSPPKVWGNLVPPQSRPNLMYGPFPFLGLRELTQMVIFSWYISIHPVAIAHSLFSIFLKKHVLAKQLW